MVDLPIGDSDSDDGDRPAGDTFDDDPLVTCECQDGTLRVFDEEVHIERASRSKFSDKQIPIADITEVPYEKRLVISYLQIEQPGVDTDEASRLSTPVDENTLHFGRGKRDCAKRARDTIYERMAAD